MSTAYLTYEQFGAVGDGIHDDMPAIVACHEEANKTLTPVKTTPGAKYNVGKRDICAIIKTDVDFGTSEFIIDDRDVENIKTNIFRILSDNERKLIELKAPIKKGDKLELSEPGAAFIQLVNANHTQFIRKGLNLSAGVPRSDILKTDDEGVVLTDIDWDYTEFTKIWERKLDKRQITITGGIFTTIANEAPSAYTYYARGIEIWRDNCIIKNITHYVTGEGDHGAPYTGFISVNNCADNTFYDCLLTPHYIYQTDSKVPGKKVNMGTYDLNIGGSLNIKFYNLKQTIDIMDKKYWGLMGTNFCKDLYFENCEMSRFDAHMGVTNVTIRSCKLGHQCLNLIGHGHCLLENSFMLGRSMVNLRSDYGSIWDGDITIKNCTWEPMTAAATVFGGENTGNHNFGYACTMPHNIIIDGLTILDGAFEIGEEKLYYLFNYDKSFEEGKPFPYNTTQTLTVSNVKAESGRAILATPAPELYKSLKFITK